MKKIALITKFSHVGISTSVINSAVFWGSKGYSVDVYTEKPDIENFPLPEFPEINIKYIITKINIKLFVDDIFFRINHFRKIKYEWIIGFDHLGLIRGGISSIFTNNKLIYHSLELFEPAKNTFKNKLIKFLEIFFSYKSKYIFTQDFYRIKFLESDLKQRINKFKIIYNSPTGKVKPDKMDYFRIKYKIPVEKKILLCVGSLVEETFVYELAESIDKMDKIFVLVFHGWFPNKIVKEYLLKKQKESNRIYISEILFSNEEKYIAFQSCDIGFVGYKPKNNNLKYTAVAGGKIYDFLKTGKPIVCFSTPGMKEIIEGNQVGICINNIYEINLYLINILNNYDKYADKCFTLYKKMEFNSQYEKIYYEIKQNKLYE